MGNIDDIVNHYLEYKTKSDLIDKKLVKLRKQIKDYLQTKPNRKYEMEKHVASIVSSKRNGISKKDIPSDLWEKYSVCTKFDMVVVRKKKQT
jgi:hypothetical protein